jgi:YD repeat-containing protein
MPMRGERVLRAARISEEVEVLDRDATARRPRWATTAPGRVNSVTDSEGYTVKRQYDAAGRVTRTTYPDGTSEQTTYDRLDPRESRDRLVAAGGRPLQHADRADWSVSLSLRGH